jgi:hypothetical protein
MVRLLSIDVPFLLKTGAGRRSSFLSAAAYGAPATVITVIYPYGRPMRGSGAKTISRSIRQQNGLYKYFRKDTLIIILMMLNNADQQLFRP